MVQRKFRTSIPVMLTTATAVTMNLEANIGAFVKDYPKFTPEWIKKFYGSIEVMSTKIGIKASEKQQEYSKLIRGIQNEVFEDARMIHSQIKRGFRNDKQRTAELLNLLGYTKYWKLVSQKNVNALVSLLRTFDNHTVDTALTDELINAEVAQHRINSMKNFARRLSEANAVQESLKSAAPAITAETTAELNKIYEITMDICSAGKIIFSKDPERKAQFNFSKIALQQTSSSKPKQTE